MSFNALIVTLGTVLRCRSVLVAQRLSSGFIVRSARLDMKHMTVRRIVPGAVN